MRIGRRGDVRAPLVVGFLRAEEVRLSYLRGGGIKHFSRRSESEMSRAVDVLNVDCPDVDEVVPRTRVCSEGYSYKAV